MMPTEMEEELPLPKDPKHQRLADLVMAGKSPEEAYRAAGFKAAAGKSARNAASRLLANVGIVRYMAAARSRAAVKAGFGRDELVAYLVEVLRTPVSKVDQDSRLAQKVKVDDTGLTIEMPGKLGAAKQLADIMGWNKPQEVKVDLSEKLADIIGRVRGE